MNQNLSKLKQSFTKKYFSYSQKSRKLSAEIKQELARLGAYKPYYADNEEERAILLIDMWSSPLEEIKNIVRQEANQHFLMAIGDEFITEIQQKLFQKRVIAQSMRNK